MSDSAMRIPSTILVAAVALITISRGVVGTTLT
jgi:hypothetical protein